MSDREQKVAEFYRACDNPPLAEGGTLLMFVNCFSEELAEFSDSLSSYLDEPTEDTRGNLVKEWADVQYTLSGLAYFLGIDGEEAFNRVADNNMTKVGIDGKVTRREEDGKILKPEGYQQPDMRGL